MKKFLIIRVDMLGREPTWFSELEGLRPREVRFVLEQLAGGTPSVQIERFVFVALRA
jgi:hypothetical protein